MIEFLKDLINRGRKPFGIEGIILNIYLINDIDGAKIKSPIVGFVISGTYEGRNYLLGDVLNQDSGIYSYLESNESYPLEEFIQDAVSMPENIKWGIFNHLYLNKDNHE